MATMIATPVAQAPDLATSAKVAQLVGIDAESPRDVAEGWLRAFSQAVPRTDPKSVRDLFLEDSYLRDMLALTWDYRTFHGHDQITKALQDRANVSQLSNLKLSAGKEPVFLPPLVPNTRWLQAFFDISTKDGAGRGIFKLAQDPNTGAWKAYTLYFCLESLKDHPESLGLNRPRGVEHGEHSGRKSWADRRKDEVEFKDSEPVVLIVGAGQGGLTLAARLKALGVPTLIVDKNDRVGDNWRKRYKFLVLHDPVWYDHLPYIPFNQTWPVFTPKDKLADWFESYASSLELNIWTQATVDTHPSFDAKSKTWTVTVKRGDGTTRTLKPHHFVLATGHSGEPNIPRFPGTNEFAGKIVHSSQHTTGHDYSGKKAVVVGCCNSGHDIAHDFYEQGADVTIVQRSSTYVMTSENGLATLFKGLYEEGGPPVEDADLIFASNPNHVNAVVHQQITNTIKGLDQKMLDQLTKVGFKLDYGDDGSGFLMKYFRRGGGYYLDVGASTLIAEGKIKMITAGIGSEIAKLEQDGIRFKDGVFVPADIVVLATGYQNMKTTAERIMGPDVSSKLRDVWGLDDEGELNAMWRDSGHPNFWFMGGNLALCRFNSKLLALQIKAIEEGILTERYSK